MALETAIEWTDATWNPVTGCSKITPGCDLCYAERFSERFRGVPGHPFENGFDLTLRPERLKQPLTWRQPRRVFVNSMSDLFHKEVPKAFVDAVFETMEAAHWHTFQVLTKRSPIMSRYLKSRYGDHLAPPHIWVGVSVEDKTRAVRLKHLRAAQASVKFVSFEPLLGSFHKPEDGFEVQTHHGRFEDAVEDIRKFIGNSFPLIFIDPTGWTGYPLDKIKPLFSRPRCEVLVNFMYDFVNRFANSADKNIIESLDPILGGHGWRDRLDQTIPRGLAVEKLFRESLRKATNLEFVVSTRIDKSTTDRPHFFIVYGTRSAEGLKAFRETEYSALKAHWADRATAKERKREDQSGMRDLFSGFDAEVQEATIDEIIEEQKSLAEFELIRLLQQRGAIYFGDVVTQLLQAFMLRETNVKDICGELAKAGKIERTWPSSNRKPRNTDIIKRASRIG